MLILSELKSKLLDVERDLKWAEYALQACKGSNKQLTDWQTSKACLLIIERLRLVQLIEQAETMQALNWLNVPFTYDPIKNKFYV